MLEQLKRGNSMIYQTGEVPERPNGAVSKTVVGLAPTVGSNPTLSAEERYEGQNRPSPLYATRTLPYSAKSAMFPYRMLSSPRSTSRGPCSIAEKRYEDVSATHSAEHQILITGVENPSCYSMVQFGEPLPGSAKMALPAGFTSGQLARTVCTYLSS